MDQERTVDDGTRAALDHALDDEYRARATYRAVLARFGLVRPFVNIVESEGRHIEALAAGTAAWVCRCPPTPGQRRSRPPTASRKPAGWGSRLMQQVRARLDQALLASRGAPPELLDQLVADGSLAVAPYQGEDSLVAGWQRRGCC